MKPKYTCSEQEPRLAVVVWAFAEQRAEFEQTNHVVGNQPSKNSASDRGGLVPKPHQIENA